MSTNRLAQQLAMVSGDNQDESLKRKQTEDVSQLAAQDEAAFIEAQKKFLVPEDLREQELAAEALVKREKNLVQQEEEEEIYEEEDEMNAEAAHNDATTQPQQEGQTPTAPAQEPVQAEPIETPSYRTPTLRPPGSR